MRLSRIFDKTGSFGTLVAALSCAGCFPALGTFGASIGMGFLASHEGFLFRRLIPAFAALALLANAYAWYRHRAHARGALSVSGPVIVLAALYPFWHQAFGVGLFYVGLTLMLAVSIFDLVKPPPGVRCAPWTAARTDAVAHRDAAP